VLAILGGSGAAIMWAAATLCSSRSSRMIGAGSVLAWMMIVGLAVVGPAVAFEGRPAALDADALGWMAVAGSGNVCGLFFEYRGLRLGLVGVVTALASTEGAIAALISVAAGEHLAVSSAAVLGVIVLGIFFAGLPPPEERTTRSAFRPAFYGLGAAVSFGASLYATGHVGEELPLVWALLPPRLAGVLAVALPLVLASRLRLSRRALPLVVVSGLLEVVGFASFTWGARHGLAISAVLASQFAAISAVFAYLLFGERLSRGNALGIVIVAVGVASVSALQA
jgi:drug/metabolite transporter (DMT)-like permease